MAGSQDVIPVELRTRSVEPGSINIPVGKMPRTGSIKPDNTATLAFEVVNNLNIALKGNDCQAITALFHENGFWRDHLALSWDLRTFKGRDAILSCLEHDCRMSRFDIDDTSAFRAPQHSSFDTLCQMTTIQFYHKFTTKFGIGRGIARLIEVDGNWKIWTMFTSLEELTGFESLIKTRRAIGHEQLVNGKNWWDSRKEEISFKINEPTVLIIGVFLCISLYADTAVWQVLTNCPWTGAGQSGLTLAARLKVLNTPTLIIDGNNSVGDNWRKRYHHLVLHDPVWYDHLPYVPFPDSWPIFTPKDKLAEFFEAYVKILELNVWMKTVLTSWIYDEDEKRWTITLETTGNDGSIQVQVVHPRHVVQATGQSGEKSIPNIPGIDNFGGTLVHSSDFRGAKGGRGKKAVVIGACNSGHDICQDFYENGYEVTMIQRSSTVVVSPSTIALTSMAGLYIEDGPPVEDADLINWSAPTEIVKAIQIHLTQIQARLDATLLQGLAKVGFRLNFGPDNTGFYMNYLQRGGGYYINVGTSQLIIDGKIKVKSGHGVAKIVRDGLHLTDGTKLEADEIVFATGYQNMRSQTRHIFGDKLADRVRDVWGFDAEGEIRTVWRSSGHPGFWFMGGNLSLCRYYSRILALQIRAIESGISSYN
jgi:cation diffusion facilitator CzcD-associated flavoprotein CzcO